MVNLGPAKRRSRQLSRGWRGRSRSPSPSPPHNGINNATSFSEKVSSTKEDSTSGRLHSNDKQKNNSTVSENPKGSISVDHPELMDHSGRTSPGSLDTNSKPVDVDELGEELGPPASQDHNLTKKVGDSVTLKRGSVKHLKREERKRSPSPIELVGVPAPKKERQLSTDHPLKGNHVPKNKSMSGNLPTLHSPLLSEGSSAAKVLTEEFQKQQGQENAKVKGNILKEFKKPGKSETLSC